MVKEEIQERFTTPFMGIVNISCILNNQERIKRYNADVILYNEIATKVCEKHDVAIIDLYTFTQGIDEEKYIDHVHFNDNIRKLQSAYIAGAVFAYSKE